MKHIPSAILLSNSSNCQFNHFPALPTYRTKGSYNFEIFRINKLPGSGNPPNHMFDKRVKLKAIFCKGFEGAVKMSSY